MKRFEICFFILLMIFGCNNNQGDFHQTNHNSYSLFCMDTLKISLPSNISNYYCQFYVNDQKLYAWNCVNSKKACFVFDLKEEKFEKKIIIKEPYKLKSPVTGIFPISSNKLFFYSGYPPVVYTTDTSGSISNVYDLDDFSYEIVNKSLNTYDSDFGIVKIHDYLQEKQVLIASIARESTVDFLGEQSYPNLVNIDLKNNKLIFWGEYEGMLKQKGEMIYHHSMHSPYLITNRNMHFVTYPIDPYVYIYSTSFELLDRKRCSNSFNITIPEPINKNKIDNARRIRNVSPFYGPLKQLDNKSYYFRFCNLGKSTNESRTRVLMLYNSEFKLLTEKKLLFPQTGRILSHGNSIIDIPKQKSEEQLIIYKYKFKRKE